LQGHTLGRGTQARLRGRSLDDHGEPTCKRSQGEWVWIPRGRVGMGLKFGLLVTGHWAVDTHGPTLAAHPAAVLAGVWGRDFAKAEVLAERCGTTAYKDVDELLADVDAVAIALPPDVQAEQALRAAQA